MGCVRIQVKEPRPDVKMCEDLTGILRARIEDWFKKPKKKEGEKDLR
jgi:hypothetical protein